VLAEGSSPGRRDWPVTAVLQRLSAMQGIRRGPRKVRGPEALVAEYADDGAEISEEL